MPCMHLAKFYIRRTLTYRDILSLADIIALHVGYKDPRSWQWISEMEGKVVPWFMYGVTYMENYELGVFIVGTNFFHQQSSRH